MIHSPLIALSSGGTGGHLFPAEALSRALLSRGYAVALFTDARGTEFAEKHPDIRLMPLHLRRSGKSPTVKMRAGLAMATATFHAVGQLRQLSPALVVGFGGYPSFPAMMAAQLMGIPTLIHEQNTIPGRANRALALLAECIATSFPHVQDLKPAKAVYVGHPVHSAFEALRTKPYRVPEGDGEIRLLVTGGSQGATIFSTVVPDAIALLPDPLRLRLLVSQQCRAEDLERVAERYRSMGITAETASFFSDLPDRLGRAHLAIGRSGASTVIENAMAGVPSIFVPLPHSLSDEQTSNAWAMETAGAAVMVKQPSFTAPYLATRLESLLTDPARLLHMAEAARDAGKPQAAENLADLVADVIEGNRLDAEGIESHHNHPETAA